jgi:hypothetical protein
MRVDWSWEAPGGARIDQVRTFGDFVFVAAMGVSDGAREWNHATIFALEAKSGKVAARRMLPDPVPVASLVVQDALIHAVATAPEEPVFAYALTIPDLRPVHRCHVGLVDAPGADVLDAWALPGGGLWLELEGGQGSALYISVTDGHTREAAVSRLEVRVDNAGLARDACESERALFVPAEAEANPTGVLSTLLFKLEPSRESEAEHRSRPRRTAWVRTDSQGIPCRTHAIAREGLVYAAWMGHSKTALSAQVIAVDRTTSVERWKTPVSRFTSSSSGEHARLAYVNGELALQGLGADGAPSSDVLLAGPGGSFEPALLATKRRFILDAALGGSLLAHDSKADGRVVVAGFSVESKAGILGRRARMYVSAETPDVGGAAAVYAGAGKILVKGERRLVAIGV